MHHDILMNGTAQVGQGAAPQSAIGSKSRKNYASPTGVVTDLPRNTCITKCGWGLEPRQHKKEKNHSQSPENGTKTETDEYWRLAF
ncbi:MAG: hypothetical protein FWD68_18745 [Alphaproteobacteria bacterium]|nr:hypothetical protein [Alphaproteobacteria bacterium]